MTVDEEAIALLRLGKFKPRRKSSPEVFRRYYHIQKSEIGIFAPSHSPLSSPNVKRKPDRG